MTATDIDIRFLRAQRSPRAIARAEVVARSATGGTCAVSLLDIGDADRLTTLATVMMRDAV